MSHDVSWDKFQNNLRTERFGRQFFFSNEVDSTNDWAKRLADEGAEEGTVAVGLTQTAGRGRLDREWVSPKGGLWFSIILRPSRCSSEAAQLVFIASLAVAETLHEECGLEAETKWPNDVLVEGKKICGILAQTKSSGERVEYVILGVGLNVNFNVKDVFPETIWKNATSIETELNRHVSLQDLLRSLLERIEKLYDEYLGEGFAALLDKWKVYAKFLGHHVLVSDSEERLLGLALDVDCDGALLLKLENRAVRRVLCGDMVAKGS